jgi:hypothetical protein
MAFLPPLLLLGIALAFFYPVLDCRTILAERDLSVFFIPPRIVWVRLAKSFTFPFWNPHNYSGIPLLATLQPGVLYPPHLLYLVLPFNVVWNWLIILHFVLAGVSMYLLMDHMKVSRQGAFVGAVTLMLSGYLLSVHNLVTHLFAISWFPLVMLQFLEYIETGKYRHVAWAALLLCVEFLAGAPEMWLLNFIVLATVAFFASSFTDREVSCRRRFGSLTIVTFLCLLLCSVQLLPFYELKSMSIRRGGLSYAESIIWSFGWRDFIRFFLDDPFGVFTNTVDYWHNESWLKTVYMGIMPFILSLFYFFSKDKRRTVFLVLMALSLVLALGGNTPAHRLLHHIPPFDGLRYPVKFLFLFIFVLSLSAGFGLDRLKAGVERSDGRTRQIVQVLFMLGFVMALLWGFLVVFHSTASHFLQIHGFTPGKFNTIPHNLHNTKRFLLFSFSFSTFLLLYARKRCGVLPYGLALLLVLDLFLVNFGYYNTISWVAYTSKHQFVEPLQKGAGPDLYLFSRKTGEELKTFPLDRTAMSSPYAGLFDLYSFGGSEVMRVGYHDAFSSLISETPNVTEAKRFFDVGGIRYLISSYPVSDPDFRIIDTCTVKKAPTAPNDGMTPGPDKTVSLYEYRKYPGRFLFFSKVRFSHDEKEMMRIMTERKVDLRRELVAYDERDHVVDNDRIVEAPEGGTVRMISYAANNVELESRSRGKGFVYSSETYYPGWKASVDGRETRIYRSNLAFRAVEVPPGVHRITFRYVPRTFFLGLMLTFLGAVLWFVLIRH